MTTPTLLEERVRRGLRAAADALPAGPSDPDGLPAPRADELPARPRWVRPAVAAAVAGVAVLGGTVARNGPAEVAMPGRRAPGAESPATPAPAAGTTTAPTPPVLLAPGQVVGHGDDVQVFDLQGNVTRTVPLGLTLSQAAVPDLRGGFVVCGIVGDTRETRNEQVVWLRADGERVVLAQGAMGCSADAISVSDSSQGPVAVFQPSFMKPELTVAVLDTRETRTLTLPSPSGHGLGRFSVAAGRVLLVDAGGAHLFDVATGAELSPPGWTPPEQTSDVALAADGTSVAAISGSAGGPVEVTVADLATGAVRFREAVAMPAEGAELAYDGATVAFGNWYDHPGYPPVTVVELASGARRTVDAHGSLP
jgi:hypothetical protein